MVTKLLVVEDELAFAQAIKTLFSLEIQQKEIEILHASHGEEALIFIENDREHEIEIILLDLVMSADRMDGFTFLQTLHEQNIYIKTIVVSAHPTIENQKKAVRENVVFFFTKPLPRLQNLKELLIEVLKKPDRFNPNTYKVRFNTLLRATKELPSSRKERLIYKLAEQLELSEIENLQQKFSAFLDRQIELAKQKQQETIEGEAEKNFLIEKLRSGEIAINANTSSELLKGHSIEERYITRKNGTVHGPYYYLRWRDREGKTKSRFLGKTDPRLFLP